MTLLLWRGCAWAPPYAVPRPSNFPLSDGGTYQGRLHSGRARRLRARALDLRSAYTQLARHPKDDWSSILGVLDTDSGRVVYFESFALPFGASSAVTGFNRAAHLVPFVLPCQYVFLR